MAFGICSNPESMYTAGSAVVVGRESICFIICFLNSSSCASGVAFGIISSIKYNMLKAWWYVDNTPIKVIWATAVKRKIHEHWSKPIVEYTPYYKWPSVFELC
jgi:hypothetical protein